jgi:hypothetical protein
MDQSIFEAISTKASSKAFVNDHSAIKINNKDRYMAPLTPRLFHAIPAKIRLIIALIMSIKEYIVY